jgi:ABC-2 type transport system permease protein
VATWNPISYLIEGFRSLFIVGWDGTALLRGFGVAIGLLAVTLLGVAGAMRTRLQRT